MNELLDNMDNLRTILSWFAWCITTGLVLGFCAGLLTTWRGSR